MAKPYRPCMDWTADPSIPDRFKVWKKQVQDEVHLLMADDPDKKKAYACTYVLVCSGEHGEEILRKEKMDGEREDYSKMLQKLEKFINPPTNILEDSIQYFFLKQGEMSVSHYRAEAKKLIERMIPDFKPDTKVTHTQMKELLLRNLLLVGLRNREVFKECQNLPKNECTPSKILEIAYQAEYRESTNKRIARTVTTASLKSALEEVSEEVHIKKINSKTTNKPRKDTDRKCRWCGEPQWCRRDQCPARNDICPKCHIKGHRGDVCRKSKPKKTEKTVSQKQKPVMSQRPNKPKQNIHHVSLPSNDSSNEEDEEPVFIFNHLTHDIHSITDDHIKPIWLSVGPDADDVHE